MNRGERATQHGELLFSATDAQELASIQRHKDELYNQLALRPPRPGRNDACICGSEKKYKKCCGR
jgi:uncharacterized protein YchJ